MICRRAWPGFDDQMLTPPPDLGGAELMHALSDRWDLVVASLEYQPVGFGSHHWTVAAADGTQWFLTVDVVAEGGFGRLEAALATATDLRDAGLVFVVAPVATSTGESVVKIDERFTVALYPLGRELPVGSSADTRGTAPTPRPSRPAPRRPRRLHSSRLRGRRSAAPPPDPAPRPARLISAGGGGRGHQGRRLTGSIRAIWATPKTVGA